jgi:hypothetical protein
VSTRFVGAQCLPRMRRTHRWLAFDSVDVNTGLSNDDDDDDDVNTVPRRRGVCACGACAHCDRVCLCTDDVRASLLESADERSHAIDTSVNSVHDVLLTVCWHDHITDCVRVE